MKQLKIIVIGVIILLSYTTKAQLSVNVNIGSPPLWGPVGYNDYRYYYLPDVEAYYDVQSSMFVYFGDGVWVHSAYLPGSYRNYDLYNGYKVVITDYRGNEPYVHFHNHKIKYKKGYRGGPQKTIGQKPGGGNSINKKSSGGQPYKREVQSKQQQGGNYSKGKNTDGGHSNGGGKGKKK